MVHIHKGILCGYKKEHISVSSKEVDETGAYYTEWSKSERETPILYITYIENLERWQWWSYMQGPKRDTDVKNRLLDWLCGRRQGWGVLREQHWNMYIITCEMDRLSRFNAWDRVLGAGALGWPRGMLWGGRWEGVHVWDCMYICGGFMSMYGKTNTVL